MSAVVRRSLSIGLALVLLMATLPSALGYAGQVASNVTITGPTGAVVCGQTYEIQATVFENTGARISDQPVLWSITSAPAGATDTLSPTTSNTDVNGVAKTSVTFGGAAGSRTIRAMADNAFATLVLTPTDCAVTPPPPFHIGTCASALGATMTGPFTPSTKVAALRRYITFKLSFGAAYAGRLIIVTRATRLFPFFPVLWGTFLGATGRIADANGDVYYRLRYPVPAWVSVRGFFVGAAGLAPAITRACQGRWR